MKKVEIHLGTPLSVIPTSCSALPCALFPKFSIHVRHNLKVH